LYGASYPYNACLLKTHPVPTYTGPWIPSRPFKLICAPQNIKVHSEIGNCGNHNNLWKICSVFGGMLAKHKNLWGLWAFRCPKCPAPFFFLWYLCDTHWVSWRKIGENCPFLHHVMPMATCITGIGPASTPPCADPYSSNACGLKCTIRKLPYIEYP
jgi:hypothetical protein